MAAVTVLNRFELGERLGSGGCGVVYLGWDQRLQREVAVKVVETTPASGPRVRREAQAAARLNHPSIVSLFEFVHHEYGSEGGRAFLVSEFVQGETVRDLLDRSAISDLEVAELGADICAALDHAHSLGVIHRDVKPANLIVPSNGHGAKLMDFGIARLVEQGDLTATGDFLGTLSYMPPEQSRGETVGPAGDLYSLALTLYEGWTGSNPRHAATPSEALRRLETLPPPLARVRPDLPPALADTIDACLEPDPAHRPRVEQLGRVLEAALPRLDSRAAPDPPPASRNRRARLPRLALMLPAVTLGASVGAVLALAGPPETVKVLLASLGIAGLAFLNARLAFLVGLIGCVGWLTFGQELPGAALVLAAVAAPAGLALRGDGRVLAVLGLGPLFGLAGVALAVIPLAALAAEWRDRVLTVISTLALTAFAASASGRDLLLGNLPSAPSAWATSPSDAIAGLIIPTLASSTFLLALPVWVLLVLVAGAVLKRRRWFTGDGEGERHRLATVGSGPGSPRHRPLENELLP